MNIDTKPFPCVSAQLIFSSRFIDNEHNYWEHGLHLIRNVVEYFLMVACCWVNRQFGMYLQQWRSCFKHIMCIISELLLPTLHRTLLPPTKLPFFPSIFQIVYLSSTTIVLCFFGWLFMGSILAYSFLNEMKTNAKWLQ